MGRKSSGADQGPRLFQEEMVPAAEGSGRLFDVEYAAPTGPVECLGQTFPSDQARREHFLGLLREKLKDPEFRRIEGFPVGTDEDILALSDPPYYTACPNPFLEKFVRHYGKPYDPEQPYHRTPFAVDVSEGKTDALYKAHSYHTKVPHLAIVPSILHYTEPGDIVLDGFCGSGMTGVAAQFCGAAPNRYCQDLEATWQKEGLGKPQWGARRAILNDLSPAATFIAANYNLPFDVHAFARAGRKLLNEVEQELGWMYQTLHSGAGIQPAKMVLESLPVPFSLPLSDMKITRRDLPHWQYPGAVVAVTFRTHAGRQLPAVARSIVMESLKHWDGIKLHLVTAVVMPDHVHAVFLLLTDSAGCSEDLSRIMHSLKSFSANAINKAEQRAGETVWQSESYDHLIRDERDLNHHMDYIWRNPVKRGLSETGEAYPWYYRAGIVEQAGWKPAPLGRIEYTVWSEVFACPDCAGEVVFLEEALDAETKRVKDAFPCPHCGAELNKDRLDRIFETRVDPVLNEPWKRVKFRPVLISYKIGEMKFEKAPDVEDMKTLERIESMPWPGEVPTDRFPVEEMYHGSRIAPKGFTHVHHFFLPRAAHALAALWRKASEGQVSSLSNGRQDACPTRLRNMLLFFVEQAIWGLSVLARYAPTHFSQVNRQMTGVYYVASQLSECSPEYNLGNKLDRLVKAFVGQASSLPSACTVTTGSVARLDLPDNFVDYIFTDPPFGENIYYADLNFLVESWHRVRTDAQPEAIVDKAKKKGMPEYQRLMERCFREYCRVLKPGRWMTVVFHNSRNAVWNAIQEAMLAAGFVVADVRTLDKQQGSYRQVTSTAVKQDLVISAYKPNGGLEQRFEITAGSEEGVWDFVRTHLRQLPVYVAKGGEMEVIAERLGYFLFDRMVAFHVQRGVTVPLSSAEFLVGLTQRFAERDGMFFLQEQTAEYDKKRVTANSVKELVLDMVVDEASALQWLRQELKVRPQGYQEIQPRFMERTRAGWMKHEKMPELSEVLKLNFLVYNGQGDVPSQIHSYLSTNFKEMRNLPKDNPILRAKAKDRWFVPDPNQALQLEQMREKSLLKEFEEYRRLAGSQPHKRLKLFRLEAVRAGFKKAWQEKDYPTIVAVAAKIPEAVLQEDAKLLMWYDQAVTRTEDA
ncbi:MAG: transposase [Magnetococcus sp. WYHC-3]